MRWVGWERQTGSGGSKQLEAVATVKSKEVTTTISPLLSSQSIDDDDHVGEVRGKDDDDRDDENDDVAKMVQ